jgi:DNA-binding SARP family transcriptional activator/Flp pilus assembly protein TadD
MPSELDLRLLGRPSIAAGSTFDLPTRKALALLAVLGCAGRTSRARLASMLWTDQAADDARRNLRQELHRLQSTPAGEWIVAAGDDLDLRAGALVDVRCFREAIARGEIDVALDLWRGPLLDGVDLKGASGFDEWVGSEREALARLRHAALERQCDRRDAAGDAAGAIAIARTLVAADPLQEAQHRRLMRLLLAAGDRAGAIAQFERCRAILRDELGLAPMPETAALAQRIRESAAQEPARAGPGVAATELVPPLVGRESAWALLEGAGRRLVLIEGEAGLGKSRLVAEFAASKGRTIVVAGREISRDTPFYPVSEALAAAWREDPRWFEWLDPVWRAEVGRLVPALADDERPAESPSPEARARLIEGLAAALLTAAGDGAIVFEDLHWFDLSSAELAAHVVRRAHRARIFATARPDDLGRSAGVQSALEAIERDGLLLRVPIAPLTEPDVLALVRAMSGSVGATVFSRRLYAATAGNPLFILESLRDLFAAGVLWRDAGTWSTPYDEDTEDYRELPIPASVRDAVLRRIDRLGPGPRRLLEAGSLAGDGFATEWVGPSSALSEEETADALDLAVRAGLVAPTDTGYRFTHDLVRRALDDALAPERRKLLHRRLAEALARSGAAPARIAGHWEDGGRPSAAIALRTRAAEDAARVHSLAEAIVQYDAALADGATGVDAFRIHSARVDLCRNRNDDEGRARSLAAMAAVSSTLDDPPIAAELAIKRAVHAFENDRYDEALAIAGEARRALAGRVDATTDASLALECGAALRALGRIEEAEAELRSARERFGDAPLKRANCAYWLCQCAIDRGDLAAARAHCDEVLAATTRAGYRRGHAMSLQLRADIAWREGARERAIADLEAALAEARAIGSAQLGRGFLGLLVERLRSLGDLAGADARQGELDQLVRETASPDARQGPVTAG